MSKEAKRVLLAKDDDYILQFDTTSKNTQCLYLVKSVMKMGSNVILSAEEEVGYNALVQFSIYLKGQLLKNNKHEVFEVFILGNTEFVLTELYSGPILQRSKDIM